MAGKPPPPAPGTLVLVVGPSGAGKDSVIAYARARLRGKVVFPRRIVTRAAADDGEDHDTVDAAGFDAAVAAGRFALHWRAHGLGYGVPAAIAADLAAGCCVVVNVSRSVLGEARARFRPLVVVSVTAPAEVILDRLRRRGREAEAEIAGRLARGGEYAVAGPDVVAIDNSGPLAAAGEAFLGILRARCGAT
jgi:ribose 1,5-bisphosphokinase